MNRIKMVEKGIASFQFQKIVPEILVVPKNRGFNPYLKNVTKKAGLELDGSFP